jgi:hypothetical protein
MPKEVAEIPPLPSWRRASKCMIMASIASERALGVSSALDLRVREDGVGDIALVVGSVSGELETTAEFLLTLAKEKMARPVLFQNSLHNATAGHVAISQKILGASFTISAGLNTPVECLRMAQTLMAESLCKISLVVLAEVNQKMTDLLRLPEAGEGALALLVADQPLLENFILKLDDLDIAGLQYQSPLVASDPRVDIVSSAIWQVAAQKNLGS